MRKFALITGASKGIGKEMVYELARRNINLLLVARTEKALLDLANEVQVKFGVEAHYLALDLLQDGAVQQMYDWCQREGYMINILINNAGFGNWGGVDDLSLEELESQMWLNQTVLVQACKVFLPMLGSQSPSYIMNVASTAAYQPMPFFGIYAATKAFVLSFSRAIRYEFKAYNISVSALCPGPTHSEFFGRSGFDPVSRAGNGLMMKSDVVAKMAVKGLFDKKAVIITGFINKLSVFFSKHLPGSWTTWMIAKVFGPKD